MRKKFLYLLIAIFCVSGPLSRAESLSLFDSVASTPFQFGLWPFQLFSETAKVYGININTWIWQDETYGLSCAPLVYQYAHYGLCINGIGMAEKNYGIQAGGINLNKDNDGIQIAAMNINEDLHGLVAGAINLNDNNHGLVIGIVNLQTDWSFCSQSGIQIGIFNSTYEGIQFGLINYNEKAWITWLPLFNCD